MFQANVAARLPLPARGEGAFAYALDSRVTSAAEGGVLFDPVSGSVYAMTVVHTRDVHRVVHKVGEFEYGPMGAALGIPYKSIQQWAVSVLPVPPVPSP